MGPSLLRIRLLILRLFADLGEDFLVFILRRRAVKKRAKRQMINRKTEVIEKDKNPRNPLPSLFSICFQITQTLPFLKSISCFLAAPLTNINPPFNSANCYLK